MMMYVQVLSDWRNSFATAKLQLRNRKLCPETCYYHEGIFLAVSVLPLTACR